MQNETHLRPSAGANRLSGGNDFYVAGIAGILGRLIRLYAGSGSVKDEAATTILGSILYAIDAYSCAPENKGVLPDALREKGADEIYRAGFRMVKNCFEQAKELYREVAASKLKIPLEPYNDTINHALPAFFKHYDMEFNAQDTPCSIDYPLSFEDSSKSGVFFIRQYLESLRLENIFCSRFAQKDVLKVLLGYLRKYRLDFSAPVNLFEILFDQAVFSVLCGQKETGLSLSEAQLAKLQQSLSGKTSGDVQEQIEAASREIVKSAGIQDPDLIRYIGRYRRQFAARLLIARDNAGLAGMAICREENQAHGKISYRDGRPMSDEEFSDLTDRILQCESTEEKIREISDAVHSVKDYIDLLDSDCLYGDEFTSAFSALGNTEIAVLCSRVFPDELQCGPLRLNPEKAEEYKRDARHEWQPFFIDFLMKMPEKQRNGILSLAEKINITGGDHSSE